MNMGLVDRPLEFLLFSDFAVVLAMVHLYSLFMVTPIFNTLMRIDRSLIEAARDAGANSWQILTNVIIPLAKPGIAIGSIFVVTLCMGDFITVRFMSRRPVGLGRPDDREPDLGAPISGGRGERGHPALAVVLLMVAGILRVVNIRKEL